MASINSLFLFEVAVEKVQSFVPSKKMDIKAEFADIFQLDLIEPKQLDVKIPEPPEPPPAPKGKKGKKAKPKKGKKGKVVEVAPPPEPIIQSGQSILFPCSIDVLRTTMKDNPLVLSLWSKESDQRYKGASTITWGMPYFNYFDELLDCEKAKPLPLVVKGEYNVFNEKTGKRMGIVTLRVKLTYLTEKILTQFWSITQMHPHAKTCIYTCPAVTKTSFICNLKTLKSQTEIKKAAEKMESTYIQDYKTADMMHADYRNARGTNTLFVHDGEYCCGGRTDPFPATDTTAPKNMPDLDFMAEYVRKLIQSCNENLRTLTPRPEIRRAVKASDLDKRCFCDPNDRVWPKSELAKRMKYCQEYDSQCPMCKYAAEAPANTFNVNSIRGPCGRIDCKISKGIKAYIENLVKEDNKVINIDEIAGPCGTAECKLAKQIQKFIRREGIFKQGRPAQGLNTLCGCETLMKNALNNSDDSDVCEGVCAEEEPCTCEERKCPASAPRNKYFTTYTVGYCTVEYDNPPVIVKSHSNNDSENEQKTTFEEFSNSVFSNFLTNNNIHPYYFQRLDSEQSNNLIQSVAGSREAELGAKEDSSDSECSSLDSKNSTNENVLLDVYITTNESCMPKRDDLNKYVDESMEKKSDGDLEISLQEIQKSCVDGPCSFSENVIDYIVNSISMAKNVDEFTDACFCDCECTFKIGKQTTYCGICGGVEEVGDDMCDYPPYSQPPPRCPIYHKLYDKALFTLHSQQKHTAEEQQPKVETQEPVKEKHLSQPHNESFLSMGTINESIPEKTHKPKATKKKIGKFTMNTCKPRLTGMPHVDSHVECQEPLERVPKRMGWLWTAENVPGLKFRPGWRPGAVNKYLVRKYQRVKLGEYDSLSTKKQKKAKVVKKIKRDDKLKKPAIVVTKKHGEYLVSMEVLKKYSKPRLINQYPYEEGRTVKYHVGRTDTDNAWAKRKNEKKERRNEQHRRKLITSTFRNRCKEVCRNAYQEALKVLPIACPCHLEDISETASLFSCTCSSDDAGTPVSESDTDDDEWVLEFTPPIALYEPHTKAPKPRTTVETQYNYLDFRVKLLDKNGNVIPRFFKGPSGKQVCSDLGGFYGPDKKWLEINRDGYIGQDLRWIPMQFIGPDNTLINADDGFFIDAYGNHVKIGIDGYVNAHGNWIFYPPPPPRPKQPTQNSQSPSNASVWTCLGKISPSQLVMKNIVPHGRDKTALKKRLAERSDKLEMPKPSQVPRFNRGKKEKKTMVRINETDNNSRPSSPKKVITVSAAVSKTNTATATKHARSTSPKASTRKSSAPYVPSRYLREIPHEERLLRQSAHTGKKDVCLLARMRLEGRRIPYKHRDCVRSIMGDCCAKKGGWCTEIFDK